MYEQRGDEAMLKGDGGGKRLRRGLLFETSSYTHSSPFSFVLDLDSYAFVHLLIVFIMAPHCLCHIHVTFSFPYFFCSLDCLPYIITLISSLAYYPFVMLRGLIFSFLWTASLAMSSSLPHHSAYYPLLTPVLTIYKA